MKRVSTTPMAKSSGKPAVKVEGGSVRTFGNMNRPAAVRPAAIAAVNMAQPMARNGNSRRVTFF